MICNTAIFYDIENLNGIFTVKNNTVLQLDEIYRRILEVEGVSGVSVQKAYTDWAVQINRNLRQNVLQIGIEPVQIFNTNQNDKIKNAADVSLIIDAVELIAKKPEIENYVIVSGDGIFAFLAKKLHEHGKRVIGCGFDRNTNIIFRNACDYFINLEKTDQALIVTKIKTVLSGGAEFDLPVSTEIALPPVKKTTRRTAKNTNKNGTKIVTIPAQSAGQKSDNTGQNGAQSVTQEAVNASQGEVSAAAQNDASAVQNTAKNPANIVQNGTKAPEDNAKLKTSKAQLAKKIPQNFARNKFSEILSEADIPIWKDNPDLNDALLTIRDLINTLFDSHSDENVDLDISLFKNYVDHYVPGFKASHYKFRHFSEFIRFMLTGSPFCLTVNDTILKITRRGAAADEKGTVVADMTDLKIVLPNGIQRSSIFDVPERSAFKYSVGDKLKPQAERGKNKPKRGKKADASADTPPVGLPLGESVAEVAEAGAEVALPAAKEGKLKTKNDKTKISAVAAPAAEEDDAEGSVRKWIKAQFVRLSEENALAASEVRCLITAEYSQQTFGIKTPVFKELETRSNLAEQRQVGGKIKYWKEVFKYNGKSYLIYKEWNISLHKERFSAWIKKQDEKTAGKN